MRPKSSDASELEEPFSGSAVYYDTLYQDKDYDSEAIYIHSLLQCHHPGASTLLEMGCGTGVHSMLLAERGYQVHGFDYSKEMVAVARKRLAANSCRKYVNIQYHQGDMRSYRINGRFDAVISLFHVVCYQLTNADLQATFETASHHLEPGGLFIFDTWYGPAVLTDHPKIRVKRMMNDDMSVIRIAEPELIPNNNRVEINFTYISQDRRSGKVREVIENHRVRYLFYPEIEYLFTQAGMDLIGAEEWLTGMVLGSGTWGACFIGQKRNSK